MQELRQTLQNSQTPRSKPSEGTGPKVRSRRCTRTCCTVWYCAETGVGVVRVLQEIKSYQRSGLETIQREVDRLRQRGGAAWRGIH